MSLSATRLGSKIGLNGQEMNVLLKEEGYQTGNPGAYSITSEGLKYVTEKGWNNGYGGYAFRGYNYNEWDEEILNHIDTSPERLNSIREKTSQMRKAQRLQSKIESENYWKEVANKNKASELSINDSSKSSLDTIIVLGIAAISLSLIGTGIYFYHKRKKDKDKDFTHQ